jgi:hypothetical protein
MYTRAALQLSGDVSSNFHASREVCLTLADYYVTLELTLNISDIIKRDKIVNVEKPTFLTVPVIMTQCFSFVPATPSNKQ